MKVKGLSLANKVALFFILVFFLGGVGLIQTLKYYHERDLVERSRTIVQLLDSFLKFSDDVHGLWVENPGEIKAIKQLTGLEEGTEEEKDLYLLHDPDFNALLAKIGGSEAHVIINYQTNEPDIPQKETWRFENQVFVYQYPLPLHERCISCHAQEPKAPKFKNTEVAGVVTIKFPGQTFFKIFSGSFGLWVAVAFLIGTLALYGLVKFELINPLTDLTRKVHEMSLGNLDIDFKVKGLNEHNVKDEIVRLAIAIERLRRSQKTMEKMLEDDSFEL